MDWCFRKEAWRKGKRIVNVDLEIAHVRVERICVPLDGKIDRKNPVQGVQTSLSSVRR